MLSICGLLEPAADRGLVVPIGAAEPPIQLRLFARDHSVTDRDRQKQREHEHPRAAGAEADADVAETHTEINGIARPAVNTGGHQRASGLVSGDWCRRA